MLNIKVALVFPELVNWDAKEQKQNIEVQFYKVYVNEKFYTVEDFIFYLILVTTQHLR